MSDEKEQMPQVPTGSWVITRIYSKVGAPIDLKASGTTLTAALDDLYTGIIHAFTKYECTPEAPKAPPAPAPKPDPAAQIAREEGNLELASRLEAQGAEVPPPPAGKTWQTVDAVFVRYLPQPDGKCTIEFYGNSHKQPHDDYAFIKASKWTWENVSGLMKHVTSHAPEEAGEFNLPCRVYYIEGKEYTTPSGVKGRYKDVCHVRSL